MWSRAVRTSIRACLVIAIIGAAFAAWEIAGVEPNVPWHTLSFLSQAHLWLAIAVSLFVALVAGGFEVWWWVFHLRSKIEK